MLGWEDHERGEGSRGPMAPLELCPLRPGDELYVRRAQCYGAILSAYHADEGASLRLSDPSDQGPRLRPRRLERCAPRWRPQSHALMGIPPD